MISADTPKRAHKYRTLDSESELVAPADAMEAANSAIILSVFGISDFFASEFDASVGFALRRRASRIRQKRKKRNVASNPRTMSVLACPE